MKSFLSSIKKKTRAQSASASALASPPMPVAFISYSYTGGDFGITFQRAKSKYVNAAGPTRLQWHKEQRLGITFVEKDDGAITVKSADAVLAEGVAVGQELIGVNGQPVSGLDFLSVMGTLKTASSPCQLDFTPPPSPIVVSQVTQDSSARMQGVAAGMVLQAVNDASMIGATLSEVNRAVLQASDERPVVLKFAPPAKGNHVLMRSDSEPTKSGLRNTACIAAVVAVLAV